MAPKKNTAKGKTNNMLLIVFNDSSSAIFEMEKDTVKETFQSPVKDVIEDAHDQLKNLQSHLNRMAEKTQGPSMAEKELAKFLKATPTIVKFADGSAFACPLGEDYIKEKLHGSDFVDKLSFDKAETYEKAYEKVVLLNKLAAVDDPSSELIYQTVATKMFNQIISDR